MLPLQNSDSGGQPIGGPRYLRRQPPHDNANRVPSLGRVRQGWIVVWRERNRTTQKYHIYKTSYKFKHLQHRIYKIILGEEDIPITTRSNKIMKKQSYMDKVLSKSIINLNHDKQR